MAPSRRPNRRKHAQATRSSPACQPEISVGPKLLPAVSEDEAPVFEEIFHRGGGTVERLTAQLAKGGVPRTRESVAASLRSLRKKGWMQRSNWEWHLTRYALQYMR
jgi:hypothetical protein